MFSRNSKNLNLSMRFTNKKGLEMQNLNKATEATDLKRQLDLQLEQDL